MVAFSEVAKKSWLVRLYPCHVPGVDQVLSIPFLEVEKIPRRVEEIGQARMTHGEIQKDLSFQEGPRGEVDLNTQRFQMGEVSVQFPLIQSKKNQSILSNKGHFPPFQLKGKKAFVILEKFSNGLRSHMRLGDP
jgi:hypothetical protein